MAVYHTGDTIVALSTGEAVSAISVVRMSGKDAFSLLSSVFLNAKGEKVTHWEHHRLYFGRITDGNTLVDEVVVGIFHGPHSYTGEDIVEISCHGSPYVRSRIIQLLIRSGARAAAAGEFTRRAFLNGKMDLSQAEAVADLIHSESEAQHRLAIRQMKGGFSHDLKLLREKLVNFTALIELELDFAEEDVEFANREDLLALIREISDHITALKNSFAWGNAIKNGIPAVIAGRPNAGKSTLLNGLLNEERAIVSNIAGTTRDTIEENLVINGIRYRLTDTAGIRTETHDEIERIGIRKTFESIERSSVLIYLFDAATAQPQEIISDIRSYHTGETRLLLLGNKMDLLPGAEQDQWAKKLQQLQDDDIFYDFIGISAKNNTNIEEIKQRLYDYAREDAGDDGSTIVTNSRHFEALERSLHALQQAEQGLELHISGDLLAEDVKKALRHIGEITGDIDVDADILGTIFGKFCIGK